MNIIYRVKITKMRMMDYTHTYTYIDTAETINFYSYTRIAYIPNKLTFFKVSFLLIRAVVPSLAHPNSPIFSHRQYCFSLKVREFCKRECGGG